MPFILPRYCLWQEYALHSAQNTMGG